PHVSSLFPYTTLFRSDHVGRDILSRLIYGGRVSLLVGLFSVIISGVIGLLLGLLAGYLGGTWVDHVLMRVVDAILAIPTLLLVRSEEHTSELQSRFDL